MTKSTIYDRRWLELNGARYLIRPSITLRGRGWYYKDMWLGYNARDAITELRKLHGYD